MHQDLQIGHGILYIPLIAGSPYTWRMSSSSHHRLSPPAHGWAGNSDPNR